MEPKQIKEGYLVKKVRVIEENMFLLKKNLITIGLCVELGPECNTVDVLWTA